MRILIKYFQKKTNIIYIIIVFVSFFYNIFEVKSCNPPYSEHIAFRFYPYNGLNCPYWIVYCCWWDSQNNKLNVYFKEVWNWNSCKISSNDWSNFRNWMMTEMYNDAISKCTPPLPSCDPPPPPTITITMSRCLKYENFLWNKYPNEAEWMLKLKACSLLNGKCENRKIVCIDYSQNPARVVTLLDECEIIQEPDCSYDEPITPPQGKTWEEAWETNCFARPCCP